MNNSGRYLPQIQLNIARIKQVCSFFVKVSRKVDSPHHIKERQSPLIIKPSYNGERSLKINNPVNINKNKFKTPYKNFFIQKCYHKPQNYKIYLSKNSSNGAKIAVIIPTKTKANVLITTCFSLPVSRHFDVAIT